MADPAHLQNLAAFNPPVSASLQSFHPPLPPPYSTLPGTLDNFPGPSSLLHQVSDGSKRKFRWGDKEPPRKRLKEDKEYSEGECKIHLAPDLPDEPWDDSSSSDDSDLPDEPWDYSSSSEDSTAGQASSAVEKSQPQSQERQVPTAIIPPSPKDWSSALPSSMDWSTHGAAAWKPTSLGSKPAGLGPNVGRSINISPPPYQGDTFQSWRAPPPRPGGLSTNHK
ncbi:uncharacterized protein [Erythrolamprus reginae]|uniref:uncharacterized protein n=1 Tax=Erythrolamprus reginae TaxID=121349 RepID=UPI00396CE6BE